MQETIQGNWDFTSVIDLVRSLSDVRDESSHGHVAPQSHAGPEIDLGSEPHSLGNFKDIRKQIGQWNGFEVSEAPPKGVHWKDEADIAILADNDEPDESDCWAGLTKQQRKKARRKARRQALAKDTSNGNGRLESSEETEAEQEPENGSGMKCQPDRKAVIHTILERPLPSKTEVNGHINTPKKKTPILHSQEFDAKTITSPPKLQGEISLAAAAAKKAKIISMLRERYREDRSYLTDARQLQQIGNDGPGGTGEGIHVFVDASNIMIGFHDALKIARSLPMASRMKRQQVSFHSLSLILARGRPIAKGVVVGSDKFPEMEEARLIGFETSILERVQKAKELTPRQRKYASRENGATSAGSGSETIAAHPPSLPVKWVEQAVDELLHLKMMESVVDAAEPSIMVLATGDAAEAEYSSGFLRMVERALAKGWKVELACWTHNMSAAYKKRDFRERWKHSFKVVELDDFAELLLSTS